MASSSPQTASGGGGVARHTTTREARLPFTMRMVFNIMDGKRGGYSYEFLDGQRGLACLADSGLHGKDGLVGGCAKIDVAIVQTGVLAHSRQTSLQLTAPSKSQSEFYNLNTSPYLRSPKCIFGRGGNPVSG
jgi:hypothetical protein